ncbi:FAD-dependent oxidoreductase [Caenimonas sedimenti]|uniref:FAD-dependent oxidoreductase n=1 Tax=Caenimonas sedimenti TaxID=2596921 RepID=A0A562ZF57_9BURK|nr:FAD-dependent oxidoreductase [Caenimonas sedimenti]TWO66625.1 FAD-dependent oxidoreductase [Caenimonas sedimenti]
MKVAIVGAGISGLAAAHRLRDHAQVTLFEAADYFGGHTHTVDLTLPDATGRPVTHGVDTGFLVFNERTYPGLIALFDELGVDTAPSDMSFSVQVPGAFPEGALEWSGSNLASVFSQPRNLLRPAFWGMLRELMRFNRLATRIADADAEDDLMQPLGQFLDGQGFSAEFRDWYLLPMIGCIWSCPTDQMLRFPVSTLIRFCHNHGLLQVLGRPRWWTVTGGARHYVHRIVEELPDKRLDTPVLSVRRREAGVEIRTAGGREEFDHVILATHADQSLALLKDADTRESECLHAIRYQSNLAVLHTDTRVLPQRKRAWAAWNYEHAAGDGSSRVCLHYLLNRLQPLPWQRPVIVSLNPARAIERKYVMGEYEYAHPVFDEAAIRAQDLLPSIQGKRRTWFCGAWTGYGFHEDGLQSGYAAARSLLLSSTLERENASLEFRA